MTNTEKTYRCCWYTLLAGTVCMVMLALSMCSCTTTQYVPVIEHKTEHHWHTDSVKERDSTHTERETIIREVDSAAMARYGIQIQANQRAWLVLQREMENRLRELEHRAAQRDTVHDSIPVPVEVEKQVPAELTKWQRFRLWFANIVMALMGVAFAVWVWRTK